MQNDYLTSDQIAARLGITRNAVCRAARKAGIQKVGRDFVLSTEDQIRLNMRPKRGRPKAK